MTVDVIIPLYKPGQELFRLLEALEHQTISVQHIILMNTEKQYLDAIVDEANFLSQHPKIKLFHLTKEEFDHGATRRAGVKESDADVFVMMTQDAIPADEQLIEKLIQNLKGRVVASYGRQLPKPNCDIVESYVRSFNYPEQSYIKSKEDMQKLGIKTYFCSNVCAAYRREIYEKLGGFESRAIFNEDMIFASIVVESGYSIAYEADARVYHSHNYNYMQQLRRNFDLRVSQVDHPDVFANVSSEAEGTKMVVSTIGYLWNHGKFFLIPHFCMQCGFKYMGYFLGGMYKHLPSKFILQLTSNRQYWKKQG